MTEAALEEVRKSRELIAQIMQASPCRSSQSPAGYLLSPTNLMHSGLIASPLNETIKSSQLRNSGLHAPSPVNVTDNTSTRAASCRFEAMSSKGTRRGGAGGGCLEQSSTRVGASTATGPSIDQTQTRSAHLPPLSPSRNDPPSLSASFDAAAKWA